MKLTLDNIIFSLQPMGGISVYWYELLKRLADDAACEVDVFQAKDIDEHILAQSINKLDLSTQAETIIPPIISRYLPFRHKVNQQTLFHSSYYRIAKNAKNIISIYDFTYEYYRHGLARWLHSVQKSHAIRQSAGIICISENTKKDLYRFFPHINIPVEVIYLGKSDSFYVLADNYQYSKQLKALKNLKYVLFVGARAGYKNFSVLVDALVSSEDISLVIIGSALNQDETDYLNQRLKNRFVFMGFVEDAQLNELYNQAFCFIYPSEYEGFGIPVIEAMSAGCPVVALAKSSIPEVAGNAGLLCDRLDGKVLSEFLTLLEDQQQRDRIIKQGIKQAEHFSWDKCYRETRAFYNKINAYCSENKLR